MFLSLHMVIAECTCTFNWNIIANNSAIKGIKQLLKIQ